MADGDARGGTAIGAVLVGGRWKAYVSGSERRRRGSMLTLSAEPRRKHGTRHGTRLWAKAAS